MSRVLTVNKLIEELQALAECGCGDYQVMFACDYGDRCHTQQALPVKKADELTDEERIAESAYSQSGLAVEEFDYDELEEIMEQLEGSEGMDDLSVVCEWREEEYSTNVVILR